MFKRNFGANKQIDLGELMKGTALIAIILIASVCYGCTVKVPVSRTLFEPADRRVQQIFSDDLGLCVKVAREHEVFTRHPSGFVGGGVPFQFELGNVLKGVTRDVVAKVFNDVYPICEESETESIKKIMTVTYTESDLIFELSYASNKFDRARYVGKADVVVSGGNKILYERSQHVMGDFVNNSVGGDSAAFERALSIAIIGMIDELIRDQQFAKPFSRLGQSADVSSRLDQLEQLKSKGKITEEEYRQNRQRILDGI